MLVRVVLHGWLKMRLDSSDGTMGLDLPPTCDVSGLIDFLQENSRLPEQQTFVAVIDGARAPRDQALRDGDIVHFYHPVSGG
jgi:hypothetical protein